MTTPISSPIEGAGGRPETVVKLLNCAGMPDDLAHVEECRCVAADAAELPDDVRFSVEIRYPANLGPEGVRRVLRSIGALANGEAADKLVGVAARALASGRV